MNQAVKITIAICIVYLLGMCGLSLMALYNNGFSLEDVVYFILIIAGLFGVVYVYNRFSTTDFNKKRKLGFLVIMSLLILMLCYILPHFPNSEEIKSPPPSIAA